MKKIVTVPNIISLIRLLLVPAIAVTYLMGHYLWAILLLAVSGLSDMLDGSIARHFRSISELGKFLDPLADKLHHRYGCVLPDAAPSGGIDCDGGAADQGAVSGRRRGHFISFGHPSV